MSCDRDRASNARRLLFTIVAALCSAHAAHAQRNISLTGKPDAAIREPFTMVVGIRELPGNAAIVTDQIEHRVFLANFGTGASREIGRQGDGPGEYRFPMAPYAGTANATWLYDASLRRINTIGMDGKFGPSVPPPATGIPGGLQSARGTDKVGRLYFQTNSFNSETGGFLDSLSIVRWNPADNKTEVLGRVWSGGRVMVDMGGMQASVARSSTPYPSMDAWVVLPDGRVALVEHEPFRITFMESAGALRRGGVIANTPMALTAADRDAFRARMAGVRSSAVLKNGGSGQQARGPQFADEAFPKTHPPFVADAVIATPEGEIWIGRSHASADKTWHYDTFDAQGKPTGAVTLVANVKVVGFGAGTVYVARTDPADDLVYLERYKR